MKVLSFQDTVTLVQGVPITGFEKSDDAFTAERREQSVNDVVSLDGGMSVAINPDKSGIITMRLVDTSDSNTYLSGLVSAAENGVFVPIQFMHKDTRNNDIIAGTQGYIMQPATITRGQNITVREWQIVVEQLNFIEV